MKGMKGRPIKVFVRNGQYVIDDKIHGKKHTVGLIEQVRMKIKEILDDSNIDYLNTHPYDIIDYSCGAMGKALREYRDYYDIVCAVCFAKVYGYTYLDGFELGDKEIGLWYNPEKHSLIWTVDVFKEYICFKIPEPIPEPTKDIYNDIIVEFTTDVCKGALRVKSSLMDYSIVVITLDGLRNAIKEMVREYFTAGEKPPIVRFSYEAIKYLLAVGGKDWIYDKLEFKEVFRHSNEGEYCRILVSMKSKYLIVETNRFIRCYD